jgi:hypothetical protein
MRMLLGVWAALAVLVASPASAYLFWNKPALAGAPATGDDPSLVLVLPKAQPAELRANMIWTLRAGLNVAALQCQFAPTLRTVDIYNEVLKQHAAELQTSYAALSAYFKRTGGKTWQTALDQYTTRTYNSFSTLQAQRVFCDTAASIGRETLDNGRGHLGDVAVERLRELRNSLKPVGDEAFAFSPQTIDVGPQDLGPPVCTDRKGRVVRCKS